MWDAEGILYDVTASFYSPSEDLIIGFFILLSAIAVAAVRLKYKFQSKPPLIIIILAGVVLFNTLLIFNDYRFFVRAQQLAKSGAFEVVEGVVEDIDSWSGRPSQSLRVNGVLLFSNKGSSYSFPEDFKRSFSVGDCVLIHYNFDEGIMLEVWKG